MFFQICMTLFPLKNIKEDISFVPDIFSQIFISEGALQVQSHTGLEWPEGM